MNVLIITGASSGIGLATAELFLAADYTVVNISRRPCPNQGVTSIQADMSDPFFISRVEEKLTPILHRGFRIVVVHNAARYLRDSGIDADAEQFKEAMQVNVLAPHALNRLCIPHQKPGSSILFVGSTLAEKSVPGCFSYSISKHAQVGMMRSLCQDLAGTGIHTANVCPGFTDTEMLRSHVPAEALEDVANMSAFGRLVEPTEIAQCLKFVSETPSLNGSVIHANLGQIEN